MKNILNLLSLITLFLLASCDKEPLPPGTAAFRLDCKSCSECGEYTAVDVYIDNGFVFSLSSGFFSGYSCPYYYGYNNKSLTPGLHEFKVINTVNNTVYSTGNISIESNGLTTQHIKI